MIQLTLTLKMTTAQVVETSVTVNNNSPIQDYVHPDDQSQPTFDVFDISILLVKMKTNELSCKGNYKTRWRASHLYFLNHWEAALKNQTKKNTFVWGGTFSSKELLQFGYKSKPPQHSVFLFFLFNDARNQNQFAQYKTLNKRIPTIGQNCCKLVISPVASRAQYLWEPYSEWNSLI